MPADTRASLSPEALSRPRTPHTCSPGPRAPPPLRAGVGVAGPCAVGSQAPPRRGLAPKASEAFPAHHRPQASEHWEGREGSAATSIRGHPHSHSHPQISGLTSLQEEVFWLVRVGPHCRVAGGVAWWAPVGSGRAAVAGGPVCPHTLHVPCGGAPAAAAGALETGSMCTHTTQRRWGRASDSLPHHPHCQGRSLKSPRERLWLTSLRQRVVCAETAPGRGQVEKRGTEEKMKSRGL